MTPREINDRLVLQIESVLSHLLPAGKAKGGEWCVGSISGEAGESLKVRMTGPKAGRWQDFATGTDKGDLLGLWAACKRQGIKDAMKDACEWLGVPLVPSRGLTGTAVSYGKPTFSAKAKPVASKDPVAEWFSKRKISTETLEAFGVLSEGSVAVFPFHTEDGIAMLKFRETKEKKFWTNKDPCPALFGWAVVPDDAREIIICEGEPDSMAYYEQGHVALSIPFGAGTGEKQAWISTEYDRLQRFDTILLSMDMDDSGKEATQDILNRLGNHRCKVIDLPKKDANECHMAGILLKEYILAARSVDPEELKSACEFGVEVEDEFYPKPGSRAIGMPLPWQEDENTVRFRPKEVTVWTGISGHGKTMVLDHICVSSVQTGERWLLASMEMAPPVHLKRLVSQASAQGQPDRPIIRRAMEYFAGALWFFSVRGTAKAERIFTTAEYAVRRYGITQIVVDSLAKCGMAEDDYNGQKFFVDRLTDFAHKFGIHAHLVCHARKGEDEHHQPGKMDVKGAGAITDMVDNVITVWRNKGKEDDIEKLGAASNRHAHPDCILYCSKQRNHSWEGRIHVWYNRTCNQYTKYQIPAKEYVT